MHPRPLGVWFGYLLVLVLFFILGVLTHRTVTLTPAHSHTLVYATMTTIPERLTSVLTKKVVEELFKQNIDFLMLNIPFVYARTGESYTIPDWVVSNDKIIVNRCEDLGPATKVLGGLSLIPSDAKVIIVDDDTIYKRFAVQGLLSYYEENADGLSCWNVTTDPVWPGIMIPSGFSGCIARAEVFKELLTQPPIPEPCRNIDDHWIGWAFNRLQRPVEIVDPMLPWHHSIKRRVDHPDWFELRLHTNRSRLVQECGAALGVAPLLPENMSTTKTSSRTAPIPIANHVAADGVFS